jgi:two-component system response regulator CpxR
MSIEGPWRLLVVDDDTELCAALGGVLRQQGFAVEFEQDGLIGLNRALNESFDLLVLDVMLPGLDGFAALSQLRKESRVPVLMLTARGDKEDRVRGLEMGADDYLAKPFDPDELIARLGAILRRSSPTPAPASEPLRVGELSLLPGARDAYLRGRCLRLTAMECEILEQLMRAAGRPVSRDQLSNLLYRRPATYFDRAVDTHISRIRHKMGEQGSMIMSVRGTGYLLRTPAGDETSW